MDNILGQYLAWSPPLGFLGIHGPFFISLSWLSTLEAGWGLVHEGLTAFSSVQFSSVQSLSRVWLFVTPWCFRILFVCLFVLGFLIPYWEQDYKSSLFWLGVLFFEKLNSELRLYHWLWLFVEGKTSLFSADSLVFTPVSTILTVPSGCVDPPC